MAQKGTTISSPRGTKGIDAEGSTKIYLMCNNMFQCHRVMNVCCLQDQVLIHEQTFLEMFGLHKKI
jgi:hypothetical protein